MIIREPKNFRRGIVMLVTFGVLFFILLSPVFPGKTTGLQYADNVFNELSKGSSNFIPMVRDQVKPLMGKTVTVSVLLKKKELMQPAIDVLKKAGATDAKEVNGRLEYTGDLGLLLSSATDMSEKLYNNDADSVKSMYNMDALQAARAWWYSLTPSIKALQRQNMVAEAKVVDQVIRRAIEPGNNFFSLPASKVKDHIFLLGFMLVFYVIYTLWYGFSIFELFEGFGLAMTKSKSKSEG